MLKNLSKFRMKYEEIEKRKTSLREEEKTQIGLYTYLIMIFHLNFIESVEMLVYMRKRIAHGHSCTNDNKNRRKGGE